MTFVKGSIFPFFTETIANTRSEIIRAVKSCDVQDVYIRHTHWESVWLWRIYTSCALNGLIIIMLWAIQFNVQISKYFFPIFCELLPGFFKYFKSLNFINMKQNIMNQMSKTLCAELFY